MSRYNVIDVSQLPPMAVLETINTEAVLSARMAVLVQYWNAADPPAAAGYDVGSLEFDPLRINQEASTYFELMLRDRVNQAARATTLAFATGSDLDAIATRYPGGVPRLANETDDRYRVRIWLSPNPLSPHGTGEAYQFFALTADSTLRDASVTKVRPQLSEDPVIVVTCMLEGADPRPSISQLLAIRAYIIDEKRKGATDVVSVRAPIVHDINYRVGLWLYPGPDGPTVVATVQAALAVLVEKQRWLGFDHTLDAIRAAAMVAGVHHTVITEPTADVDVDPTDVVRVLSIQVIYLGRTE